MNKAAQALGRLGGKAGTGKAKAQTSEQARAAARARWKRAKTKTRALRQNDQALRSVPAADAARKKDSGI